MGQIRYTDNQTLPHDRRGLAFHPRQKNTCWLRISLCSLTGRILGVHLGGRGADDLRDFLRAFPEAKGRITFTDDLSSYAAVLPHGGHFTGKLLTQKLESLNANVRHRLARFARRTRCTTKCPRMAHLSALLFMQAHNKALIS